MERTLQKGVLTQRRCSACDKANFIHRWPGSPLPNNCEGILPCRDASLTRVNRRISTSPSRQQPPKVPKPLCNLRSITLLPQSRKNRLPSTDTSYLGDTRRTTSSPLVAFLKSAAVSPFTFRNGFTSVVGLKPSGGISVHSFRTDRASLDIDNRGCGYFTSRGRTQFPTGPVF